MASLSVRHDQRRILRGPQANGGVNRPVDTNVVRRSTPRLGAITIYAWSRCLNHFIDPSCSEHSRMVLPENRTLKTPRLVTAPLLGAGDT
jgi:hypothetical protein